MLRKYPGIDYEPQFTWADSGDEEPHKTRRTEMLRKYPQIVDLMGHDPMTKWKVVFLSTLQLCLACQVQQLWPTHGLGLLFFFSFTVGGMINHSLFIAMHEISHGLAFKSRCK